MGAFRVAGVAVTVVVVVATPLPEATFAPTVTVVELEDIPSKCAEIPADPVASLVTTLSSVMATLGVSENHCTESVMVGVEPSEYVPTAVKVNWAGQPILVFVGVTAMDTRLAAGTGVATTVGEVLVPVPLTASTEKTYGTSSRRPVTSEALPVRPVC
jgi:hypothetical protein